MKKIFRRLLLVAILGIVGFAVYFLNGALPIGTGYTAKYLCSQVFIAGRDPITVFENDIKPTHFLFSPVRSEVNRKQQSVTSKAFGFWKPMTAFYREGCGCTLAVDTTWAELLQQQTAGIAPPKRPTSPRPWPHGETVVLEDLPPAVDRHKLERVMAVAFQEPGANTKRNTQAIVVVYDGQIIAEKYERQFNTDTPILGWSMSKSVTSLLVGVMVKQGLIDIHQPAPVKVWQGRADPRREITLDHLLRMSSGLEFEEVYGPFKDATYMLYTSKSMAAYAAAKSLQTPPDSLWNYSGGTTNIITRIIQDRVGGTLSAFTRFARQHLFHPVGIYSAIMEPDASGVFVGSSYIFATARDWARLGLLILQDGIWEGEPILPPGWVDYVTAPTPKAPRGQYGAQFWLNAGSKGNPADRLFPSLPADLVYMGGFNKQIVAVIPSRKVVVVRLGATHDDSWNHEHFIAQVLACLTE